LELYPLYTVNLLNQYVYIMSELHNRPDSPCIGVCSTLFDDECKGCGRTVAEVSNWVFLSEDEKNSIWSRIKHENRALCFRCVEYI
jgi:uncharacterized protein